MKLLKATLLLSATLLVACAPQPQPKPQHETPECMNYRGMMTAPMAPDAMQRLKDLCEKSRH